MDQAYGMSFDSRSLSERRGKPELQPLGPVFPSTLVTGMTAGTDLESSDSSLPSGIFSSDTYGTPALSAPVTPTDVSPARSQAMSFPTIEEEEEFSNCDCGECEEVRSGRYGLGLAVGAVGTMGTKDVAFPRLDAISTTVRILRESDVQPTVRDGFEGPYCNTHYHLNEKLAPVAMPPTPPCNSDAQFMFSTVTTPTSPEIDADAFTSTPPSLPQSPKNESPASAGRSRAAIILNKVVPAKLRASLRRRMSGTNENTHQLPPLPCISTMPNLSTMVAPDTPPTESFRDSNSSAGTSSNDNSTIPSSPEGILPPSLFTAPLRTDSDAHIYQPQLSPRSATSGGFRRKDSGYDFPSLAAPAELMISPIVTSPLYPPTISPLMSPVLSSTSQVSLSTSGASSHTHRKLPSIDPATSLVPRTHPELPTVVTADSLADMIEEMQSELSAYDATLARMKGTGWSSPQEIRNVELQREEHRRTWEARISESKKILESARRNEAMSSVSSFDSFGSVSRPLA